MVASLLIPQGFGAIAKPTRRGDIYVALTLFFALLAPIFMGESISSESTGAASPTIHVILRLWPYVPTAKSEVRKCPVCGMELPASGAKEETGAEALDRLLSAKVSESPRDCRFVVPDEQRRTPFALDNKEDRALVQSLAAVFRADEVLYPVLLRYRQRVGSEFAASRPAAVVFHLHLLDSKTLKEVWGTAYAEEQQALSENLLKSPLMFKRKFRWVTAERIMEDGVNKAFKNFPECEAKSQ